jgi:hypothetical protein
VTGATGATGEKGETGRVGVTGPTGATGLQSGAAAVCLPSKATETGLWSANLEASAGAPQGESDAVVSYPVPLCETTPPTIPPTPVAVETVYLTEFESGPPIDRLVCKAGSQNEAAAEPGKACVFTGNRVGAEESQWKNAKFVHNAEPDGNESLTSGKVGFRVVFATTGFIASGKGTVPAGGAYLVAGGPWAVTAP